MPNNEFFRTSNLTGKTYNFFETVKIKNITQSAAYIDHGVFPVDIRVGKTEDNKRILLFYFDREESKDVFDKWCRYELD